MRSLFIAQKRLLLMPALSLLLLFALVPVSAQTVDNFVIMYGDTVSDGVPGPGAGNIEVGGAQDVYMFTGTAGDGMIFDVLAGSNGTFRWKIAAPDATILFDGPYVDRQVALAQTGTHTITVYGFTGSSTGVYSFALLLAPAPQNFVIGYGDTVLEGVPAAGAGNLEVPGAQDVYMFSGTAGDVAIFDWLSGSNGSIGWRLNAPDGSPLFDNVLADLQTALTQTGTYTLTVRGNGPASTGAYSFSLLLAPNPDLFAIAYGDTVSDGVPSAGAGNLEAPGALDVYSFVGTAGQSVIVDALSGNASQLGWRLNAPDGAVLFDGILFDRQVALTQSGTYTLTVRGNAPANSGVYSFQLLLVPAPQDFTIALGDTVSDGVPAAGAGHLEAPGSLDVYSFDVLAGQQAVFDYLMGNASLLGWRLNAPDGSVVFDAILGDRQVTLTQTGTYVLTVRGNQVASFGLYSFQLLTVPTSDFFTIAIGDTVSDGVPAAGAGNLELPGAQDIYSFSATAGQEVIFDWLSGNNGLIGWRLNAPDGSEIFNTILSDRQYVLNQTGVYTLTLRGNAPATYGVYSFSLLSVSAIETFNISLGDTVSDGVPAAGAGNLEAAGAIDRYLFSATAGQWIYLDFLAGNNGLIGWRLEAPDGSTLFDSFLTDRLLQLDQTGVYTLILRGNNPDDFGTYSFALLAQDTFGLEFTIQPNAVVTAGELFTVLVQVIDPVTGDPRPLEDLDVTLILIDDATGMVVPGYSWSGITGINGAALINVSIIDPGIYRLRTDVAGYSAMDSDVFEVAGISGMGGAFLPQMDLNGEEDNA